MKTDSLEVIVQDCPCQSEEGGETTYIGKVIILFCTVKKAKNKKEKTKAKKAICKAKVRYPIVDNSNMGKSDKNQSDMSFNESPDDPSLIVEDTFNAMSGEGATNKAEGMSATNEVEQQRVQREYEKSLSVPVISST